MKDILWTRGLNDWSEDRRLFGADESRVLQMPCIRIQSRSLNSSLNSSLDRILAASPDMPDQSESIKRFRYFVFTSINAARIAAANPEIKKTLSGAIQIYTHGAATHGSLLAAGLNSICLEAPTGKDMAVQLTALLPPGTSLLWPCGEAVAHDFTNDLLAAGIKTRRLILYDTIPELTDGDGKVLTAKDRAFLIAPYLSAGQTDTNTQPGKNPFKAAVCFASPSAVKCFTSAFASESSALRRSLLAIAIGPTTANAADEHFNAVEVCPESTVAGLAKIAIKSMSSKK